MSQKTKKKPVTNTHTMHTAYLDHSAGYPQTVTHFEPDDEADQAFYVHNVARDLDRLTPAHD